MGQLAGEFKSNEQPQEEKPAMEKDSQGMMHCDKCGYKTACKHCGGENADEEPVEDMESPEEYSKQKEPSIIGRLMVLKKSKS